MFKKGNKISNTGRTRFKKGEKGFWTGKKRPNMTGEKNPSKKPEVREKISKNNARYWLGKKQSSEVIEKRISQIRGEKNGMWIDGRSLARKGKKEKYIPTKEHKKKIGITMKGRKYLNRKSPPPFTEEHRKNLKENNPHYWLNKRNPLLTGNKNPNWKDGITPENMKERGSLDYKLWRKSVFERDNFTCQKYGISGGELNAHHINNFSDFPELRFAIDNGITLSKKAHLEFHNKYSRKNNTKEQLLEFLNNK